MDNYIRVYENAFSDELCDRLINKFESTPEGDRERHDMGEMHFSQVNFRACGWKEEQDELCCSYAALMLHDDGLEITVSVLG